MENLEVKCITENKRWVKLITMRNFILNSIFMTFIFKNKLKRIDTLLDIIEERYYSKLNETKEKMIEDYKKELLDEKSPR